MNRAETPLTDEGLVYLKNLRNLEWLILNGTKITDQGLSNLASLTSLRRQLRWDCAVKMMTSTIWR